MPKTGWNNKNPCHSPSNHEQENENEPLLRAWTPVTTRLLQPKTADSTCWYVLDNVMEQPKFVDELRNELERNGLLKNLKSARTQGEVKRNEIMSLLQQQQTQFSAPDDAQQQQQQQQQASNKKIPSLLSVRGDKSTFVARDLRHRPQFALNYPNLAFLIQCLETTVQHHLSHALELNLNLTSVQLAEFPGDRSSSYPRHCDRQASQCRQENSSSNSSTTASQDRDQRLLTAIYYLTPEDWDRRNDGGCLRIYSDDNEKSQEPGRGDDHYVDVAPYSNRFIIFRSDGVEHEVRPSLRRPRLALTIWLYGKVREGHRELNGTFESTNENDQLAQSSNEAMMKPEKTHLKHSTGPPPPLPIQCNEPNTNQRQPTIFVSVAAYRDSETGPTLRNLAAMASHPDRVFVGLVLQLDSAVDEFILGSFPTRDPWYQSNVRCLRLEAQHALGPCYARALCQTLYRGEAYVLQIDSHMRFRKNWDAYLIQELEGLIGARRNGDVDSTNQEKVMLTAYPVGYQLPDRIPNETRGTLLVPWKFDDNGLLRQRGRLFRPPQSSKPVPCHLYAAGFNFSRSDVLKDCPYDESLHHLFFGEELSMAVRLYTHGYDLYAPTESVCYHLWSRDHRPTHSAAVASQKTKNSNWHEKQKQQTLDKVRWQLLGCTSDSGENLGVGSERSPLEFAAALGVDFAKGVISDPTASSLGSLRSGDFVSDSVEYSPDESLEGKVQALEPRTKDLIASFLRQI